MSNLMKSVDLKHGFDNIKKLIEQSYKEWKKDKK